MGNSDLACVKEMIEALSTEGKKDLFQHFAKANGSSTNFQGVTRPTTPTDFESRTSTSKRPLTSPGSPKRGKKDWKVSLFIILHSTLTI